MNIEVHVKTNSKKSEVVEGDVLKVYVKASPEDGKANKEVIKLLSKHFGTAVTIVKGKTSKKKIIKI